MSNHPSFEFEYSVSRLRDSTSPLTGHLTCSEVRRTIIHLSNNEPSPFSCPDLTTVRHTASIPLTQPSSSVTIDRGSMGVTVTSRQTKALNLTSFSQTLLRYGVTDCSAILRDIEEAVLLSSSQRDRGVIEVEVWKINSRVRRLKDSEEDERCCSHLLAEKSIPVFEHDSNEENGGCVICLEEDYSQGCRVAKLPCGHCFHALCITKWLPINSGCPMCRFHVA